MVAESAKVGLQDTHTCCVHIQYSGRALSRLEQKHHTQLAGGSNVSIITSDIKSLYDSPCKTGVRAHMLFTARALQRPELFFERLTSISGCNSDRCMWHQAQC